MGKTKIYYVRGTFDKCMHCKTFDYCEKLILDENGYERFCACCNGFLGAGNLKGKTEFEVGESLDRISHQWREDSYFVKGLLNEIEELKKKVNSRSHKN